MRLGIGRTCATAVLVILVPTVQCWAQRPDRNGHPSGESTLKQYRIALSALEALASHVQASGTLSEEYFLADGKVEKQKSIIEFRRNSDARMLKFQDIGWGGPPPAGSQSIFLQFHHMFYTLKKEHPADTFYLKHAGPEASDATQAVFTKYERAYLDAARTLHGVRIDSMLSSEDFELDNCEVSDSDGQPIIRFTFHFNVKANHTRLSGWWTVAPAEGWTVQDYAFQRGRPDATTRGHVQYSRTAEGHFVPSRVEASYTEGNVRWGFLFAFDTFRLVAPPESEFNPSAFGPGLRAIIPGSQNDLSPSFALFGMAALALTISVSLKLIINKVGSRNLEGGGVRHLKSTI
jgi:hypothetical protein